MLPFRQIHLDFHTHGDIPDVGAKFCQEKFIETLREARVNSVTLFAKCHHGWSYYDTKVARRHPHLKCELLDLQLEACREAGIRAPIYISAGLDDLMAMEHPEWRVVSRDGVAGNNPLQPGFKAAMRWNSPYLDYLCAQIEEVVTRWPDANGIWLDIIAAWEDFSPDSLLAMDAAGLDPEKPEDVKEFAYRNLLEYYRRTNAAARIHRADMPVFHNSGNISIGAHEAIAFNSHLELESLPTAGWGYDHFPLTAAYAATLGMDYLGMTGKFHNHWGEFGGFKRPAALRYECAAMLAAGAKCSIGDQLHPSGEMNADTYRIIGEAYRDVETKEPWCAGTTSAASIGLYSAVHPQGRPFGHHESQDADIGASRMLLEAHLPFVVLDEQTDWSGLELVVLPDAVVMTPGLADKLKSFLSTGGKVLASGTSLLDAIGNKFVMDAGVKYRGISTFDPDYLVAEPILEGVPVRSPIVIHGGAVDVEPCGAEVLASRRDPYFNKSWRRHCSHMHSPDAAASPFPGAVRHGNLVWFAHRIFTRYKIYGQPLYRDFFVAAVRNLLEDRLPAETSLPSTGRVMLRKKNGRFILHLLHAVPVLRGESVGVAEKPLQIIEDIEPLHDVTVKLRLPAKASNVRLVPSGEALPFTHDQELLSFTVPRVHGHQMLEIRCL
jgi:hypothetical protein